MAFSPDWRVEANTDGKIALQQGELKVGPLKMNIADLWNRNEQKVSKPLFRAFDRYIASNFKVRPQAERLWRRAERPLRVGKAPPSWLVLAPERVRIAQPVLSNNTVTVALGLDVRAHVVVSDQSPEPAQPPSLPPLAPLANPSNRFAFVVPVLLPYGEAAALAMRRLNDKPVVIAGMKVSVKSLSIVPSATDVVVATRFCVKQSWDPFGWFDSCGQAYLRGTPKFDASANMVRVTNVHYDVASESLLLTALSALAGPELGRALESKLVFGVGKDIAKLDNQIRTALAKPEGRGVRISGDVQSFGAPSLTWTDQGFLATFPAQGTVAVDLNLPQ